MSSFDTICVAASSSATTVSGLYPHGVREVTVHLTVILIYLIVPAFYGSSESVRTPSSWTQSLVRRYILCDIFRCIHDVKEALASVMADCNSALVYKTSCHFVLIILHRLKQCHSLIHHLTRELYHAPRHSLPKAPQWNSCSHLQLPTWHNTQVIMLACRGFVTCSLPCKVSPSYKM
jgi:hypothetical protein